MGLPLLASGAPLGALRFSFTRPRQDHRRGAGVPGGAGRPVRAGPGAGDDVRARAHHGRDAAAQPAARPAADGAGDHPGGQLPAGDPEHGDRRRLVRRVPAAGRQAGGGRGRRHGQGADRRGRHGPGPQRAARAGPDRPAAGRGAGRAGPAVHRHRAGRAGHDRRLPGRSTRRPATAWPATPGTCRRCCCRSTAPPRLDTDGGRHAAGLGQPAPAVRVPAAARQHRGAVFRWTGGEPQARPGHGPGRAGRGGGARPRPRWWKIRPCCWITW